VLDRVDMRRLGFGLRFCVWESDRVDGEIVRWTGIQMDRKPDGQEARRVGTIQKTSSSQKTFSSRLVVGVILLVAGMSLSIGGCNEPSRRARGPRNEPINTGLGSINKGEPVGLPDDAELIRREGFDFGSVHNQIQESTRQLNVYFANLEIDGVKDTDGVRKKPNPSFDIDGEYQRTIAKNSTPRDIDPSAYDTSKGDDGVRISLLPAVEDTVVEQVDPEPQTVIEPGHGAPERVVEDEEEIDPWVRKEELVRELAAILATLASTSDDPGSAALALASLEMLLPEDMDPLMDDGVLSEAERISLDAARAFLRSLSSDGAIASPSEVASQLEYIQAQLSAWAGLSIKKAALCTWVQGYGWYETFPSYRFIAGRSQAVIVYVELERFAQRELSGPDGQPRFEINLSQRLELYHVADDLNTWNRKAQTVSGETRNRLRDYYLTNQITLPGNLGVGRYHLKVVMRDLIGERVAEAIIPIEIVSQ